MQCADREKLIRFCLAEVSQFCFDGSVVTHHSRHRLHPPWFSYGNSRFLSCKLHIGAEIQQTQLHRPCSCQGAQFERREKKPFFMFTTFPSCCCLCVYSHVEAGVQVLVPPLPQTSPSWCLRYLFLPCGVHEFSLVCLYFIGNFTPKNFWFRHAFVISSV